MNDWRLKDESATTKALAIRACASRLRTVSESESRQIMEEIPGASVACHPVIGEIPLDVFAALEVPDAKVATDPVTQTERVHGWIGSMQVWSVRYASPSPIAWQERAGLTRSDAEHCAGVGVES